MTIASGAPTLQRIEGGVTAATGVRAGGVIAGLKASGTPDMALVAADRTCAAAAVLTRNQVRAAPVVVTADHLLATGGRARAVLLNSGSANVCTGDDGVLLAARAAAVTAEHLRCHAEEVLLCSTGVIGVPVPAQAYLAGIGPLTAALSADGGHGAARAIMTTDTVPKEAAVSASDGDGRTAVVGGMAKGAGMIAPSMATMLCVVTTDAMLQAPAAAGMLRRATEATFNRISVDGVMSTNDTIILLATGAAGDVTPDEVAVEAALTAVLEDLSLQVVRDGEGATRVLHIAVTGATDAESALSVARQVGGDDLVRTALAGADPNWGRIIAAVGAAPTRIDPDRVRIDFGPHAVCVNGVAVPFDRAAAATAMGAEDVHVTIDLGMGTGAATFKTCDLTHGYITINAEYTT